MNCPGRIAYWIVISVLLLAMAVSLALTLSGCSAFGQKGALSVGPRAESGGTDVTRASYQVELTKGGFTVAGEVGQANLSYRERALPDGTAEREIVSTSTEASPTKASRGWVIGVLADLSLWGWLVLVIAVVGAVAVIPGAGARLIGAIGAALGLFYPAKTVERIVKRSQSGIDALDADNEAAFKKAARATPAPDAVLAVGKIKARLKARGDLE